eukprot:TRINITY_DN1080_c1_g1_i1.p1 TRINITY_DN1080_c1_g1~~TRINITY_DN1080_c1_g1_i1.p1  ORF type:complete len:403 (+),score=172.19 TRINITY_DN1080_c1_g1_i1:111-1319(+)
MSEVYVTPEYLLKNFSKANLEIISSKNGVTIESVSKKGPKSSDYVQSISLAMEQAGMQQLVMTLDAKELKSIVEEMKIPLGVGSDNTPNKPTKAVCQRRLKEQVLANGAEDFFKMVKNIDHLKLFISITGVDPVSDEDELVSQAVNCAHYQGICNFLAQLPSTVLEDLMIEAGLKYNTDSKGKLISALAGMHAAKRVARPEVEVSAKKLPLKTSSKLTYADIHTHYNKSELLEFCEEKDLKAGGNKKEVINRILLFLNEVDDDDKENDPRKFIMVGTKKPAKKAPKGYAVPTKTFSSLGLGPKKSKKKAVKKDDDEEDADDQVDDEVAEKPKASKKSSKKVQESQVEDSEDQVEEVEKKSKSKKSSKKQVEEAEEVVEKAEKSKKDKKKNQKKVEEEESDEE